MIKEFSNVVNKVQKYRRSSKVTRLYKNLFLSLFSIVEVDASAI